LTRLIDHHPTGAEASPAALTCTIAVYGFTLKMPADLSAYPPDATPERDATSIPS
jgi:hypothetical protein